MNNFAGRGFRRLLFFALLLGLLFALTGCYQPVRLKDFRGRSFTLRTSPERLVSLVPEITDLLIELGCAEQLIGCTWHSIPPAGCALVGGFALPSPKRIVDLEPDLVLADPWQCRKLLPHLPADCRLLALETSNLDSMAENMELVGKIVGKPELVRELIDGLHQGYSLLERKTASIPAKDKRRVMRLMGRNRLLVPGDDSFQNDLITLAGGRPPAWGLKGQVLELGRDRILDFDPQFIFNCGSRADLKKLLSDSGWAAMSAVKGQNYYTFPCALTCRPGFRAADFAAWLASVVYPDYFSRPECQVLPEEIIRRRPLKLDLSYVARAEVIESRVFDFPQRTLLVDLKEPMQVLSTLEGWREAISSVGNHYLSPPTWNLVHRLGPGGFENKITALLERDPQSTTLLFTGADMNNLVCCEKSYQQIRVMALVTAGVSSNAVRMGAEEGLFYEGAPARDPGTINVILMVNARLSQRAMTRAIISACEGKTAALQDLDIRSTSNPAFLQATGTGTDNVSVVEGRGSLLTRSGGHSRLGELIAKAVYEGVLEAVERQNGIRMGRNVFQRLRERRIELYNLVADSLVAGVAPVDEVAGRLGELLMQPVHAEWLEKVFVLSDAWSAGRFSGLESFRRECLALINQLGHCQLECLPALYQGPLLPQPLRLAFDSLLYACLDDDQAKCLPAQALAK